MDIKKLTEMLLNSRYVVFFGGAGVSTESNILISGAKAVFTVL
jgi:NAD-dependent SIR2 family protein deacetylase